MSRWLTAFAALLLAAPAATGQNDLGALATLEATHVLTAARLIETGKVYSLAVVTGADTPAYGYRNYQIQVAPIYVGDQRRYGANRLHGNDDLLISYLGIGTQIDGFAHVGVDGVHFGGVPEREVLRPRGVARFGIETLPPIVTRGVLLDMTRYFDDEIVADSTAFNREAIEGAARRQGVGIGPGDVVLFHTGWMSLAESEPERFIASPPGLGVAGARYLADLGVVAIGGDQWALEALPAEDPETFLPVHGALLVERGVYILENVYTGALAADEVYEFFFMLAAPRFEGAVQSVVHPVAIR
ncbi:MAG: cyclase family protein [Gammaproteobacteria bacterium]